ncbi:DUF4097 family beta strand repeat-containing protein [Paenibacillus sp. HJGM_3]|uniref:DUF4097 family beta strand repeat-containing protein n=1 Tax=Paenibacillus sp. HJGM_3 TaxID=3379816 RepID=UPI00385A0773
MTFRKKRMALLASIAILVLVAVLDVWITKDALFEKFGRQFINEAKTEAYWQAKRGAEATAERQLDIDSQGIREVLLAGERSHMTVKRAPGRTIQLRYTVTANAAESDAAERKRDAVLIEKDIREGRLSLAATAEGRPVDPDSVSIDYELLLPDALKLRIESKSGSIRIQGVVADMDAASENGSLEIVDVAGAVSVRTSYGSLYMANIKGSVSLENLSSEAIAEGIQGAFGFESRSGRNDIAGVTGTVSGSAEKGSVRLNEIAGPVEMHGRAAKLQLSEIRNQIRVMSELGDLKLVLPEAVGYAVDAKVRSGRIRTHLPFPVEPRPDEGGGSQLKGVVGTGTWKVDVEAHSADIQIHTQ